MIVKEAMNRDVVSVKRSTSLRELLSIFKDFHTLPLIPVVDNNSCLIGIVSAENLLDLLRLRQSRFLKRIFFAETIDVDMFDLESAPAMGELILIDDIMETIFIRVREEDALEEAYKNMKLHNKERIPVVSSEGKLLGMIGIFDIIWRMFKEKGIV